MGSKKRATALKVVPKERYEKLKEVINVMKEDRQRIIDLYDRRLVQLAKAKLVLQKENKELQAQLLKLHNERTNQP